MRELTAQEIEMVAGGLDVFGDGGGTGTETVTVTAPSLAGQGVSVVQLGLEMTVAGIIILSVMAAGPAAPVVAAAGITVGANLLVYGGLFVTSEGLELVPATPK
jgi:hypothetical protein